MNYQSQQDFFAWEAQSRDTIDFKTVYVDMADDLMAGLLLSQLVYWHLPKRDGSSRMRVSKEGNLWVAKTRTEWWAETRLKPRQVDRVSKILVKKGLVFTNLWKFAGSPTTHWRINWDVFLPSLKRETERWKENCNLPQRGNKQTQESNSNDTQVITSTETVAENVTQIDPPVSNSPIGESPQPQPAINPEPSPQPQQAPVPALTLGTPLDLPAIPEVAVLTEPQQATDPATLGDQPDSDTEPLPSTVFAPGSAAPEPPLNLTDLGVRVVGGFIPAPGDATVTAPEPPPAVTILKPVMVKVPYTVNADQVIGPTGEPPDALSPPAQPAQKRDYLTDLFAHANRKKPSDGDTHIRPKHWESVSDDEFAICQRVAFLWCGGRLPFPGSIEAHCGAAGWLLELSDGNLGACIRALDEYHLHYEAERMTFTVAGPKSLVAVLPAFLAQEGGGGEPGVIRVGG